MDMSFVRFLREVLVASAPPAPALLIFADDLGPPAARYKSKKTCGVAASKRAARKRKNIRKHGKA